MSGDLGIAVRIRNGLGSIWAHWKVKGKNIIRCSNFVRKDGSCKDFFSSNLQKNSEKIKIASKFTTRLIYYILNRKEMQNCTHEPSNHSAFLLLYSIYIQRSHSNKLPVYRSFWKVSLLPRHLNFVQLSWHKIKMHEILNYFSNLTPLMPGLKRKWIYAINWQHKGTKGLI